MILILVLLVGLISSILWSRKTSDISEYVSPFALSVVIASLIAFFNNFPYTGGYEVSRQTIIKEIHQIDDKIGFNLKKTGYKYDRGYIQYTFYTKEDDGSLSLKQWRPEDIKLFEDAEKPYAKWTKIYKAPSWFWSPPFLQFEKDSEFVDHELHLEKPAN